ncbi:leucine-rich repeat domain-containing protein [Metamycoplasma buccale]|uniref:leucine-rich repeat domain-containing protein n=1 Tax=Metamycoplasma buccale TaxID=55602 RepID=UPI00398E6259
MKKNKRILLISSLAIGTPIALASLTFSCSCGGEKTNTFATEYIKKTNKLYDEKTQTLDLSNQYITHIPSGSFSKYTIGSIVASDKSKNNLYRLYDKDNKPNLKIKKVILPNSLRYIGKGAFEGLDLEEIEFRGNNLKKIDERAFFDNSIKNVTLPDSVEEVQNQAFAFNKLESVTLGSSIKELSAGVFSNNKLKSFDFKNVKKILSGALANNEFTTLTLPDSVEEVLIDFVDGNKDKKVKITIKNNNLKAKLKEELKKDSNHSFEIND